MDQKSQLSTLNNNLMRTEYNERGDAVFSLVPESKKYGQNYRVYRIKLPPIDITEAMAHQIFEEILKGRQAIVLGNSLVMCSCISSIDPLPIKKKPRLGHTDGNVWIEDEE